MGAEVRTDSWTVPQLFRTLQELGGVDPMEMFRVFNMGVGMIVVVSRDEAGPMVARLAEAGEDAWILGHVIEEPGVRLI
jgi:phosphoribosylformylglycinamidine cyclo-ligase